MNDITAILAAVITVAAVVMIYAVLLAEWRAGQ